jgi:hypothetical protein
MSRWIRSIIGIAITSLLAGPTVFYLSLLLLFLSRVVGIEADRPIAPGPSTLQDHLDLLSMGTIVSSLIGVWIAVPASILNAIALRLLATRNHDSGRLAALVGGLGGCVVLAVLILFQFLPPPFTPFSVAAGQDYAMRLSYPIAGLLRGLIYWLIAIRSHRPMRSADVA